MAQYKLFHPDTKILGQVILDFESAVGYEEFGPILEKHGLTHLDPDEWYPGQRWIDVLNDIAALQDSAMLDFVSMGIQQMALVEWPPEFSEMTIPEIMRALNDVYRMNYQGTDVGGIDVKWVDTNHIVLAIRSFEPDDLWYGNIYGLMRLFAPGRDFTVYFDETRPRHDTGGSETTHIHVTWA